MEVTAESCARYLEGRGVQAQVVRELGGGVSNRVLLVETAGKRLVLKQSLDRLRVADEWRAERSRVFRERQGIADAGRWFPRGSVPQVLWSDDENFLFAMSAAPEGVETWKTQLLDGRIDPGVAATVGVLLGLLVRHSWGDPEMERRYGDQTAFDQLRIDPYHRTVARRRPEVADRIQALVAESAARRVALVHGDWSPKNFLVHPGGVMVIDFEVVHYGDPSFDAAFCLNHFLLKCFRRPELAGRYLELARVFWTWLEGLLPRAALPWFERATVGQLGALLLARIDGKSPVEYLTGEPVKQAVRELGVWILKERPQTLETCYRRVEGS